MNSGVDHETTDAVNFAAEWLRENIPTRILTPIIPLLRQKFGPSARDAIQAVCEARKTMEAANAKP